MNLLAGLETLGLGNIEKMDLYDPVKEEEEMVDNKPEPEPEEEKVSEADFLFDKSYNCPICDNNFKTKTVRAGRAKMIGSDTDLRPRYESIDVIKYDAVVCPRCGYSALSRYFKFMTNVQARMIKTGICMNFRSRSYDGDIYTYDEALERYKLVLANAIIKKSKNSEKAYICLKTGWLLRGMIENLEMDKTYVKKKLTYSKQEEDYLKSAYEGFLASRSSEPFPLCGMDEQTVDYLLAALSVRFHDYEVASKLINDLSNSKAANAWTKEKVRLLREEYERDVALHKKVEEAENKND